MRTATCLTLVLLILTTHGRAEEPGTAGSIRGVTTIDQRPAPARIEVHATKRRNLRRPPGWRSTTPDPETWLGIFESKPMAVVESGADGRFAVGDLPCGSYRLTARGDQGERASAVVRLDLPGQVEETKLELLGGDHDVRGVVTDRAGKPFHGVLRATLFPTRYHGVTTVGFSIETARDGSFSVAGLPDGKVAFTAVLGPGWLARFQQLDVARSEPLRLLVDDQVEELRGRVTDEAGKPVAGALVEVSGDLSRVLVSDGNGRGMRPISDLSSVTRVVRTDAEGRFRAFVPGFDLGYRAIAPGYLLAWATEESRDELPEGRLEIRLTRAARVTGRVLFPGNVEPVAGIPVLAVTAGKPGGRAHAFTDEEGRYVIEGLRPGKTTVFVTGAGWIARDIMKVARRGPDPLSVTLAAGETGALDVAVVRAGSVAGRLVDADRDGVTGAKVEAMPSGRFPPSRLLRDTTVAVSGPEGRFRIDGLVPGASYVLRSRPRWHLTGRSEPIEAVGGKTVRVKLGLPRSHCVRVEVVDAETGKPVPNATVKARVEPYRTQAAARADGVARVGPLPPGEARISAEHPAYLPPEKSTEVRLDARTGTVRIALVRGQVLVGKCVTPDGKPLSRGQIMLGLNPGDNTVHKTAVVKADGTFRIVGLPLGTHEVDLRVEGWLGGRPHLVRRTVKTGSGEVRIVIGK